MPASSDGAEAGGGRGERLPAPSADGLDGQPPLARAQTISRQIDLWEWWGRAMSSTHLPEPVAHIGEASALAALAEVVRVDANGARLRLQRVLDVFHPPSLPRAVRRANQPRRRPALGVTVDGDGVAEGRSSPASEAARLGARRSPVRGRRQAAHSLRGGGRASLRGGPVPREGRGARGVARWSRGGTGPRGHEPRGSRPALGGGGAPAVQGCCRRCRDRVSALGSRGCVGTVLGV